MPFVKLQKTNTYHSRMIVASRRRREGKTDYQARRALVIQDKNKQAAPKYRLVARITNHYVIAQVVCSELNGDRVVAAANSAELRRQGVEVGLKNQTACYLTGLLVARRVLAKVGLADTYKGIEEPTGEVVKTEATTDGGKKRTFYVPEVDEERKPFRAQLDVGIRRTTTGARVFGVLKGAVDGGLDIPHNEKRFPGQIREAKKFDADEMRSRITGGHIKDQMEFLAEEDDETQQKKFKKYLDAGLEADDIEEMQSKAAEAIRADPTPAPKTAYKGSAEYKKLAKLTLEQRQANLAAKKAARAALLAAKLAEGADEEEEDEE